MSPAFVLLPFLAWQWYSYRVSGRTRGLMGSAEVGEQLYSPTSWLAFSHDRQKHERGFGEDDAQSTHASFVNMEASLCDEADFCSRGSDAKRGAPYERSDLLSQHWHQRSVAAVHQKELRCSPRNVDVLFRSEGAHQHQGMSAGHKSVSFFARLQNRLFPFEQPARSVVARPVQESPVANAASYGFAPTLVKHDDGTANSDPLGDARSKSLMLLKYDSTAQSRRTAPEEVIVAQIKAPTLMACASLPMIFMFATFCKANAERGLALIDSMSEYDGAGLEFVCFMIVITF